MLRELRDRLRMLTAADQTKALSRLGYPERTEVILGAFFILADHIDDSVGVSAAEMRSLLYDITKSMPGLPSLDELAGALEHATMYPTAARVLGKNARNLAHALAAPSAELQAAGLEGAWLRGRRAIADYYEAWRQAIAAAQAQAIAAAQAPVRHPDGVMRLGAELQVWLSNSTVSPA